MTAAQILDALRESTGLPWAYRFFEITPPFPFGVLLDDTEKTLYADNKPYFSTLEANIELYDAIPNETAENAIESWLGAHAVTYRKDARENVTPDDESAPFFMRPYHLEVISNADTV